jgi:hypothetical protein
MIARAEHLLGHRVATILTDTAYAGGADATAAAAAGVTLYAPLPYETTTDGGRLPKSAFAWRSEMLTYECPQGHLLVDQGATEQKCSGTETVRLHQYRCPPEHCQGCPLQAACTSAPQRGRTISRSALEKSILTLRQRMSTRRHRSCIGSVGRRSSW